MKKKIVLKLSLKFWDNYKLFLRGKITRKKLEKSIEELDDAVFYREYCNHKFDSYAYFLKKLEKQEDEMVDNIFQFFVETPPYMWKKMLKEFVHGYTEIVLSL